GPVAHRSLPGDERMRRVLAFGCAQLGVPVGILARVEAERCQVVEAVGAEGNLRRGSVCWLDAPCPAEGFRSDQPIGLHRPPRARARSYSCTARVPGVQAFVATPVRVRGALYGALEFASFEPVAGLLSRHNRALVALLAEWVAAELADQQARPELKRISRRDRLILAEAGEGIYCVDL